MDKKRKQALGPLQREWLRCLRSGQFEQSRHALFGPPQGESDCYSNCCLGVACLVAEANGVKLHYKKRYKSNAALEVNGSCGMLPDEVVKAMQFHCWDGSSDKPKSRSLSNMNDSGMSFEDITDYVKEDPARVFAGSA